MLYISYMLISPENIKLTYCNIKFLYILDLTVIKTFKTMTWTHELWNVLALDSSNTDLETKVNYM